MEASRSLRLLRPICRQPARASLPRPQRRHRHTVPTLEHDALYRQQGIGGEDGPISAGAYQLAWTNNQARLIDRINHDTIGTAMEDLLVKDLAIQTARLPARAALFNYASMAHNNHFFFNGLSPKHSSERPEPTETFLNEVTNAFSSFSSLRQTFLATANSMFGPGFVWLVYRRDPSAIRQGRNLGILNTYLAGSPYPAAHFRMQSTDRNTEENDVKISTNSPPLFSNFGLAGSAGSAGQYSAMANKQGGQKSVVPPGAQDLVPLMCLSTWEHVYLMDWGIEGKEQYLERVWEYIDWQVVEKNMAQGLEPRKGKRPV